MATSTHMHEVLGRAVKWEFRESIRIPSDLGRYCKANSAIEFRQDDAKISFCLLFSAGCSHLAAVEAYPSEKTISIAVYRLHSGFEQKWTASYNGTNEDFQVLKSSIWYDTPMMQGGVTEDGQTVLLVYWPVGGPTIAYIVNANGFARRKPPSDTGSGYSPSAGKLSEDSEHIFYTRRGSKFGKTGQAEIVEVYSIRHLARVNTLTFGFGDRCYIRNIRLLPQLRARGPIYMAIETSSFDGEDAIAKQIHHARYSPNNKVITIVTVNSTTVVINVLLTFNLQYVYHETVKNHEWSEFTPLRVGFNDSTGLNVCMMYPTGASNAQDGLLHLFGVSVVLISMPEIYKKIKSIEDYFDHTGGRVATLMKSFEKSEINPKYRFGWRPGVMERNDPAAITLELGTSPAMTAEDSTRQQNFYASVFAQPKSSVRMDSTPELRQFFVPYLFSFTFPWAPKQRVSVFGVVMKNEYHVITIGPGLNRQNQGSEVFRVLYASDIKVSSDNKQDIAVYQNCSNYILHVSEMGDRMGAYSGAPMPIPRWTVISPHFFEEDAWYDTFVIHRAIHITMPTGWMQTPNQALILTANFYAYFEQYIITIQNIGNYGHRNRSAYVLPKYLLWRKYGLRGLQIPSTNEIFFGGGRFADHLGRYFRSIYEDKTYNDSSPLFPSTLALACNVDHSAQRTKHVDAFFRRLHQNNDCLLDNSQAVSCTLPLACKARPIASLSFMRHISLFPHKVNDIGAVAIKKGETKSNHTSYESRWYRWRLLFKDIWSVVMHEIHPEPNKSSVTLPLPGFCSFHYKLYRAPPISRSMSSRDDSFWDIVQATYPSFKEALPRWEVQILQSVARSGKGAASPFTRLVEEILDMKGRDIQLEFLRVVWLEKLLAWKMKTFGLHTYLTRTALPMLILFLVHLIIGVLLTGNDGNDTRRVAVLAILLACIEVLVSCYILFVKIRQLYRIPRLFVRSIFNYIDGTALCLGLTMSSLVMSKTWTEENNFNDNEDHAPLTPQETQSDQSKQAQPADSNISTSNTSTAAGSSSTEMIKEHPSSSLQSHNKAAESQKQEVEQDLFPEVGQSLNQSSIPVSGIDDPIGTVVDTTDSITAEKSSEEATTAQGQQVSFHMKRLYSCQSILKCTYRPTKRGTLRPLTKRTTPSDPAGWEGMHPHKLGQLGGPEEFLAHAVPPVLTYPVSWVSAMSPQPPPLKFSDMLRPRKFSSTSWSIHLLLSERLERDV
ncbi:MAG: hypothetical protein Q9167_006695 [Letrouitia subvulpina]